MSKSENSFEDNVIIDNRILSVINMFDYYMSKKIIGNGIDRITVLFFNNTESEKGIIKSVLVSEDYVNILIGIDFSIINKLELIESRKTLIEVLLKGLFQLCEIKRIEKNMFEKTMIKIEELNFSFSTYLYKKPIKNKRYTANIFFTCTDAFNIYLEYKNDIITNQIHIGKLPLGNNNIINFYYKSLSWYSDNTIKILQSNSRDYWEYNIVDNQLFFHYPRAENGDAHGQYDLAMIYLEGRFGVLENKETALKWLKKSAYQGFKRAINKLKEIK